MSGYVGDKNKIFEVHLICMNCLRKVRKQPLTRASESKREKFPERSRCFQWCRKRLMMERTQLSSMEGVRSITSEKSESVREC